MRLGPAGYAGQFQQRPSAAGGGRFRAKDFRYYTASGGFYRLVQGDGSVLAVKVSTNRSIMRSE